MKMDPFKLEGAALDWAVTACEGLDIESTGPVWGMWGWASDWGQGGPIIEREGISIHRKDKGSWFAFYDSTSEAAPGKTPLQAAMRCFVAGVFGFEIDIPEAISRL